MFRRGGLRAQGRPHIAVHHPKFLCRRLLFTPPVRASCRKLHRVRPPEKNKVRFDGQLISAYTLDLAKPAIWGFRTVPYVGADCNVCSLQCYKPGHELQGMKHE